MAGNETTACGKGGTLCIECPSGQACGSDAVCISDLCKGKSCNSGFVCNPANGSCESSCKPSNCTGCCSPATGMCLAGNTSNTCGKGGAACQTCLSPAACTMQMCQ